MKKIILFLSLGSILVFSGCLFTNKDISNQEADSSLQQTQTQSESIFKESDDEEILENVSAPSETISEEEVEANIIVEGPKFGELLSSPMVVFGKARVFENTVNVDVKKENGDIVISEVVNARAPEAGEFGEFSVRIHFQFTHTNKGTIEVYSLSAKDGAKENLVSIPVEFVTEK